MQVTIHGHFYQPPREDPWTGRIPSQPGASPYHDWNARIGAECYGPNARSRILDEKGRIEEIVNNYDSIHFDFGPTLLHWLEEEEPDIYRDILAADRRSVAARGGHGNAIAQAYNHLILPLASYRDKRTQIAWGLRDFEYRFGRKSEAIWLPETAIDLETLRLLVEFRMRYVILAPGQAKRFRPLSGGPWTDVSGGRIDPRRAYRAYIPGRIEADRSIDVFFYDGPLSVAVSFEHLLRNGSGFADRIHAAGRGPGATGKASPETLVHLATDGEVYGHHEPFGDMCLAYFSQREAPLRGMQLTNYGEYLDRHPSRHEVEIDFGEDGEGTSWSCAHGVGRWRRDCGCSIGGRGWNQRWRSPLRKGLDDLRDRLLEVYAAHVSDLVQDPWEARDDYISIILEDGARARFLEKHARRPLSDEEKGTLWKLLESQHQGMLMFTSCAWFFDDIGGIEAQQNLMYAARAIELAQPFTRVGLEERLLGFLVEARSNVPEIGTGADIWKRWVAPRRKTHVSIAVETAGLLATRIEDVPLGSPAFRVEVLESGGSYFDGGIGASLRIQDRRTDETRTFRILAGRDPDRLMVVRVEEPAANEGEPPKVWERSIDGLAEEMRARVIATLLGDLMSQEEARFDEIFETSRPLLERYHGSGLNPPPIFQALASDVVNRRFERAAAQMALTDPRTLEGTDVSEALKDLRALAESIGVTPALDSLARVIERAIDADLAAVSEVRDDDVSRVVGLLLAAERNGIAIRRTKLEERAYALMRHHQAILGAHLAGLPEPRAGIDPQLLIRLAECTNLSLRTFEMTGGRPERTEKESVDETR
ncbi:MAG: DUF3536 domain-containing protein [Candidatus Eisenbacteria bacterium]